MEYQNYTHLDVWNHIRESVKQEPDKAAVRVGEKCFTYRDLFQFADLFDRIADVILVFSGKAENDIHVDIVKSRLSGHVKRSYRVG